jgi:putative membrane protein
MRKKSLALFGGGLMLLALPIYAATNSPPANASALLNQANQINHSEVDMADMLSNKAGDNTALSTLATTLKDDHQANESAVKSLADQQNINLKSYEPDKALKDKLDNLKGDAFNKAFLDHELADHREALRTFENARSQADNHDMKLYIDETIPVLKSHLEMIQNVQRDMGAGEYSATSSR